MLFSKIIINLLNFFDYFQQKKILNIINKKFLKPITVFDVGAHHGETVKLFLNNVKIKKIYSFEASFDNFKILEKNIHKNTSHNVEIFNFGIGEIVSNGLINQTAESSSSTINELNLNSKYFKKKLKILNIKDKKKFFYKTPIKILTLDSFIKKNNILNVDLLKIDTEGYEYNVLRGLSDYYHRIKLVYFEHHYDDMIVKNYKFRDIHDLLKKKNFKMIYKSKMFFRKSFEYVYENQKI